MLELLDDELLGEALDWLLLLGDVLYWKVADPNSAAVPTLESATGSGQRMAIAVGLGRSSELFEFGMRFLEQTRIQRSSRVPFRAEKDSSSFNSSC